MNGEAGSKVEEKKEKCVS